MLWEPPRRCSREFGMKWRVMLELVGPDGIVGVYEVGGRAAAAEYAPQTMRGNRVIRQRAGGGDFADATVARCASRIGGDASDTGHRPERWCRWPAIAGRSCQRRSELIMYWTGEAKTRPAINLRRVGPAHGRLCDVLNPHRQMEPIGLTLEEGKYLLAALQALLVQAQAEGDRADPMASLAWSGQTRSGSHCRNHCYCRCRSRGSAGGGHRGAQGGAPPGRSRDLRVRTVQHHHRLRDGPPTRRADFDGGHREHGAMAAASANECPAANEVVSAGRSFDAQSPDLPSSTARSTGIMRSRSVGPAGRFAERPDHAHLLDGLRSHNRTAIRFSHLAHRSAAVHKLTAQPQHQGLNLIPGKVNLHPRP